jgi:hypothetical protein
MPDLDPITGPELGLLDGEPGLSGGAPTAGRARDDRDNASRAARDLRAREHVALTPKDTDVTPLAFRPLLGQSRQGGVRSECVAALIST